jgi:hypothetical protein
LLNLLQETEKANQQAMQVIAEAQASVPVAEAPVPSTATADLMDVDQGPASKETRGTKRLAEDELTEDLQKKIKLGTTANTTAKFC